MVAMHNQKIETKKYPSYVCRIIKTIQIPISVIPPAGQTVLSDTYPPTAEEGLVVKLREKLISLN